MMLDTRYQPDRTKPIPFSLPREKKTSRSTRAREAPREGGMGLRSPVQQKGQGTLGIAKHKGPGDHPSGSPQTVHAPKTLGIKKPEVGAKKKYIVVRTGDRWLHSDWEKFAGVEKTYMLENDAPTALKEDHALALLKRLRSSEFWRKRELHLKQEGIGFDSEASATDDLDEAMTAAYKKGEYNYALEKEGSVVTKVTLHKIHTDGTPTDVVELWTGRFDFNEIVPKPSYAPRNALEEEWGVEMNEYPGHLDWVVQQAYVGTPGETLGAKGSDIAYEHDRLRKERILQAVSAGDLMPDDAESLGVHDSSHSSQPLEPLPETLWSVTTAADDVMRDGFKSRDELGQVDGKGLGGGPSNTVSFTPDEAVARAVLTSMLERHDLLNGKITVQQLREDARAGKGADKPYWLPLAHAGWDTAIDHPTSGTHSLTDERSLGGFHEMFSLYRDRAGGLMDPLYFSDDAISFKQRPRDQLKIIKVRRAQGKVSPGRGYKLGGGSLPEWRTFGGRAVTDLEVLDA